MHHSSSTAGAAASTNGSVAPSNLRAPAPAVRLSSFGWPERVVPQATFNFPYVSSQKPPSPPLVPLMSPVPLVPPLPPEPSHSDPLAPAADTYGIGSDEPANQLLRASSLQRSDQPWNYPSRASSASLLIPEIPTPMQDRHNSHLAPAYAAPPPHAPYNALQGLAADMFSMAESSANHRPAGPADYAPLHPAPSSAQGASPLPFQNVLPLRSRGSAALWSRQRNQAPVVETQFANLPASNLFTNSWPPVECMRPDTATGSGLSGWQYACMSPGVEYELQLMLPGDMHLCRSDYSQALLSIKLDTCIQATLPDWFFSTGREHESPSFRRRAPPPHKMQVSSGSGVALAYRTVVLICSLSSPAVGVCSPVCAEGS
jgi:hypothetical protein